MALGTARKHVPMTHTSGQVAHNSVDLIDDAPGVFLHMQDITGIDFYASIMRQRNGRLREVPLGPAAKDQQPRDSWDNLTALHDTCMLLNEEFIDRPGLSGIPA
jgi:hypothetical protein